jgi:hypothetical protein
MLDANTGILASNGTVNRYEATGLASVRSDRQRPSKNGPTLPDCRTTMWPVPPVPHLARHGKRDVDQCSSRNEGGRSAGEVPRCVSGASCILKRISVVPAPNFWSASH